MGEIARDFDENSGNNIRSFLPPTPAASRTWKPWLETRDGEMPTMMFQLRLSDGKRICLNYGDVREVRCQNAGVVELIVFAATKLLIRIEGRHLRELADLMCCGLIRWMEESSPRRVNVPEASPEIERIEFSTFTGN